MESVLIANYDMEIGGVERSLINLLNHFDYTKFNVDLMLYSHTGDLLDSLPDKVNLLSEMPDYTSFRKPIKKLVNERKYLLAAGRVRAKLIADYKRRSKKMSESGYIQMQLMWKYSLKHLPKLEKYYDTAISYLWPHNFVAFKVNARKKVAWIHTDYSKIDTDIEEDLNVWKEFDHLVAVSDECKNAFLSKYPQLSLRVMVVENTNSPDFIKQMSKEEVINPLLTDPRFKIITVARLSYAKGIDLAVETLKVLREKGNRNISWYIVGYGGEEKKLKKLIQSYDLEDSFILLGKKYNPYPYIQAADLYVQPSRYEGKAVTVLEAQILSKPVMISNYPTAAAQLSDGEDGYITEASIKGLVKGIERLIDDQPLRERLSANCIARDYSKKEELEKLYEIMSQ
ncbi:glycosyltransferase [Metabacillus sp. JX24]|uniref:glycosyltransferase n=1 Tax=Metabacillus sp. JX24 TaxID=3240759 RepID=UPI00350EC60F